MDENTLYGMSDEELENEVKTLRQTPAEQVEEEAISTEEAELPEEEEERVGEDETSQEEKPQTEEESTEKEELIEPAEVMTYTKDTKHKSKANGQEYEFTLEELLNLAPKAMDYTKKTMALAPYRKTISALEENGVSEADINLFIDIKKGNKEALAKLVKDANIDVLELEDEGIDTTNYTPTSYGKDEVEQNFLSTIARLKQEPEFTQTQSIIDNLDKQSQKYLYENPDAIVGLQQDIKDVVYEKFAPQIEKMAAIDNYSKPILEYYALVMQDHVRKIKAANNQKQQAKAEQAQKTRENKKSAGLPKGQRNIKKQATSYLDIDDEEYLEWYKNLE